MAADGHGLRALLFDFDGLIADTEPLHYTGFRAVAEVYDIELGEAEYYERYVGFDDADGFRAIFRAWGRGEPDPGMLKNLIEEKAATVERLMRETLEPRPGAVAFIEAAAGRFHMGVCSGALHAEVRLALDALDVTSRFSHIVSAQDVVHGKPDPEGYRKLMGLLSADAESAGEPPLAPEGCVVLEDTVPGLRSGRAAGCRTIGVVGTESPGKLQPEADLVVDSLEGLDPDRLAEALDPGA